MARGIISCCIQWNVRISIHIEKNPFDRNVYEFERTEIMSESIIEC